MLETLKTRSRVALARLANLMGWMGDRPQDIGAAPEPDIHVDPVLDRLWPVAATIRDMRRWSPQTLQQAMTGDAWLDNMVLNKWECATGATRLESFPWRFSVPFVLCNAKCEFCSAWLVKGQPMPLDLIERLQVALPYLCEVDMVGWGEPLIHPQFEQIIELFRERCDRRARIALTTNGVHLEKWADKLLAANIRTFAISIHAATSDTHVDLMGLPRGSFEKVLAGIRKVTDAKAADPEITVGLAFIVTKQNLDEIPQFIALAQALKVDSLFLRTLKARTADEQSMDSLDYHRLPAYLHEDFEGARSRAVAAIAAAPPALTIEAAPETWSTLVYPEEVHDEMIGQPLTPREIRRSNPAYRREPARDTRDLPLGEPDPSDVWEDTGENPYGRQAPMFCPSPYTAFYINGFDRQVTPCCYMARVPGHKPIYLRKDVQFDQVWNAPAMVELRRSMQEGPLKPECRKCAFFW